MFEFERPVAYEPRCTGGAAVELRDESGVTISVVRAGPESAAAGALGVGFGRSVPADDGALVVAVRPGEWLVLGEMGAVSALIDRLDRAGHVSVVDLTHGRAVFRLAGEAAPKILAKICSLDWGDAMMPNRAVASATVARIACDIVRDDTDDRDPDGAERSYLILSDRSSAQYLFDAIVDAGTEFDIALG